MENPKVNAVIDGMMQELRRGSIPLAVMSQLQQPQYGYALVVLMKERGFEVEANTLYPLLRRLEKQGILESIWNTEGMKPRKFYRLSKFGHDIYLKLADAWNNISSLVNHLIDEEES